MYSFPPMAASFAAFPLITLGKLQERKLSADDCVAHIDSIEALKL